MSLRPAKDLTDLVSESVPGGLAGDAKGDRDPVPAPALGTGCGNALGDHSFAVSDLVGGLGDSTEVGQVIDLGASGVKRVSQALEPASGFLDFRVAVRHVITPA